MHSGNMHPKYVKYFTEIRPKKQHLHEIFFAFIVDLKMHSGNMHPKYAKYFTEISQKPALGMIFFCIYFRPGDAQRNTGKYCIQNIRIFH